jgi:hypothetical protein
MMIPRDANGCVINDGHRDFDEPCNVCGGRSRAMWCCEKEIYVCSECAINTLPRLIADAVCAAYSRTQASTFERIETEITRNYWKALAFALVQRGKDDSLARIARSACQCEPEPVEETP